MPLLEVVYAREEPLPVEQQVAILFAGTQGLIDDIPVAEVRAYEEQFHRFMQTRYASVLAAIRDKKVLDDEIKQALTGAIREVNEQFSAARAAAAR